jgi:hypothetical protein
MFDISNDSEKLFGFLDKNFPSSFELNQNQVFIVDKIDFYVILFTTSVQGQNFTGFKINKGTDFRKNANLLLSYFQDKAAEGKTEFEIAVEELSEYLMGLYPEHLFFDAH